MGVDKLRIVPWGYGSISPSRNTINSLLACAIPSFIEIPFPLILLLITLAPACVATPTVLSSEQSSTTITSEVHRSYMQYLTILPIVFSSFKAGIMTVSIVYNYLSLYIVSIHFDSI